MWCLTDAPLQPATCTALLHATIDVGSFDPDGPGPLPDTRSAADTGGSVSDRLRFGHLSAPSTQGTAISMDPAARVTRAGRPRTTCRRSTRIHSATRSRFAFASAARPSARTTVCGNNFSATCEWFFTGARPLDECSDRRAGPGEPRPALLPWEHAIGGLHPVAQAARPIRTATASSTRSTGPPPARPRRPSHCSRYGDGPQGRARDRHQRAARSCSTTASARARWVRSTAIRNIPQGQELDDEGVVQGCRAW